MLTLAVWALRVTIRHQRSGLCVTFAVCTAGGASRLRSR